MKSRALFAFIGILVLLSASRVPAARATIAVGPVEYGIKFGDLVNAPNGHISFQPSLTGYDIWVPGRRNISPTEHAEGGFLVKVHDFTPLDLAAATPDLVLTHLSECLPLDTEFDRNYSALNAVVPGVEPGTLLGFYDAELHPTCESQPLLSSIGLGISYDGGVTWLNREQVIPGRDEATLGQEKLIKFQMRHPTPSSDDGASGPSAVERVVDGVQYIYLYYADRERLTADSNSVYVARARLDTNGTTGNWESWAGSGWGPAGDQTVASKILPAGEFALQPHVSWNTALNKWLMVFKGKSAFEVTTSTDGLKWLKPVVLLQDSEQDAHTGFPTLVSAPANPLCSSRITCPGVGGLILTLSPLVDASPSQQVTTDSGYLYYSARPNHAKQYEGRRTPFSITIE